MALHEVQSVPTMLLKAYISVHRSDLSFHTRRSRGKFLVNNSSECICTSLLVQELFSPPLECSVEHPP